MDEFQNLHFLPNPVAGEDGHYLPFSEVSIILKSNPKKEENLYGIKLIICKTVHVNKKFKQFYTFYALVYFFFKLHLAQ